MLYVIFFYPSVFPNPSFKYRSPQLTMGLYPYKFMQTENIDIS